MSCWKKSISSIVPGMADYVYVLTFEYFEKKSLSKKEFFRKYSFLLLVKMAEKQYLFHGFIKLSPEYLEALKISCRLLPYISISENNDDRFDNNAGGCLSRLEWQVLLRFKFAQVDQVLISCLVPFVLDYTWTS